MFDLKKQLRWAQVKVGLIISLAILILFLSVFFAGSIERLIHPKVEIKTAMKDVKGLKKGAPVWVYGIEEGSVENISLDSRYGTVVTISLYRSVLAYLKEDATTSVLTMGLLGDKYIELNPGSSSAGPLRPGEVIPGATQIDLKEVMEAGGNSMQKMTDFMDKLGGLVEKIDKSKGSLASFLDDPSLYENLRESSRQLALITKEIREGRGTIGMMVKDPSLYDRLASASKSLEGFSRKIEGGSGTLNKLIEDDLLYQRLAGAASSMEEFGNKLNTSSGTLGKFIEDPGLYENLSRASIRLSSILDRIENGEGAAGTLLRDENMAREMKETVGELRKLTEDIRREPRKYFKFSLF